MKKYTGRRWSQDTFTCFAYMWTNCGMDTDEESPYPSANGGYYNRKVYSDSYFAPTHTLKRVKKERKSSQENPPDLVSPSDQPVYARVGPPGLSWRNGTPSMTSFTPHKQVYHGSTRSEPGNML
ncbi:hypothetical protein NQ315_008333 [Exocentrus adspersus]|uniref:Uncharacterized protein n=1 Tax=Exocentrus adspersus TaxID=1586481 RepID=A0AAV8VAL0_9CUCU|nr:hypothetical protein NQ315_008333 [Exocentrus adspersus]